MNKTVIDNLLENLDIERFKQAYFTYMNQLEQNACQLDSTSLTGLDSACRTMAITAANADTLVFCTTLAPLHQILLAYVTNTPLYNEVSDFLSSITTDLLDFARKKLQKDATLSSYADKILENTFMLDCLENKGEKSLYLEPAFRKLCEANSKLSENGTKSAILAYYNTYEDTNKVFFTTLFFLYVVAQEQPSHLAALNTAANTMAQDFLNQMAVAKPVPQAAPEMQTTSTTESMSAMDFLATNITTTDTTKESITTVSSPKKKINTVSDTSNVQYTSDAPADDSIVSLIISMFTTVYNFFYKRYGIVSLVLYAVLLVLLFIRKFTFPFIAFILTYLLIIMFFDSKK